MATCFSDCQPGEYLDYGLFIPGLEYRPLPVSESPSEYDEEEASDLTSLDQRAAEAAVDAIVQKSELQEKFDHASGGDDFLSLAKATGLAQEMGLAPSLADEDRVRQQHASGKVDIEAFKGVLKEYAHGEDTKEHLLAFFRHYDTAGTGQLSRKQIKNLLTNFGEPLTEQEVDDLFSKLGVSSDPVNYGEVIARLLE